MASDRKPQSANSIPIRFPGDDRPSRESDSETEDASVADAADDEEDRSLSADPVTESSATASDRGPQAAELIAARAEIKRLQGELAEAREAVARRQADLDN